MPSALKGRTVPRSETERWTGRFFWTAVGATLALLLAPDEMAKPTATPGVPSNSGGASPASPLQSRPYPERHARAGAEPVPTCLSPRDPKQDDEDPAREEQLATNALQVLFGRLSVLENLLPGRPAEGIANEMLAYQEGFAAGVQHAGPEVLPYLADSLEHTLCTERNSDAFLMVAARLFKALPELATERSFECVFSDGRSENVGTWSMLEAWRDSDVGTIPAITRLQATARDATTRRLLLSEAQQRSPSQGAVKGERE